MLRKKFVSISFTPERVQLIELNADKNRASKYASINLPKGLIENYEVKDVAALAKILKATWQKMKIKECAVGLAIPEFSTFSKLFALPKLSVPELDEAVRWQAQEYLPEDVEGMILDWKIVGTTETEIQILAVAMDNNILGGYVKAAEEAKLFPLVVETPSLSLARLAEKENLPYLIVYNNFGEIVIVVSKGKEIFASSVVRTDGVENVVKTAQRITSHYKDIEVEKILIGGSGISQELVDELGEKLGKNVEWIKEKVKGLDEAQVQEYLIPISLQRKEAYEPADETTVNLLPAELAEKYKSQKRSVQIWSVTLTTTLLVWTSFLSALASYLFLGQQVLSINTGISQSEQAKQNEIITNEINSINATAEKVLKIKDIYIYPQDVLNEMEGARPSGVTITNYDIDFDKGTIEILGVASDRPALISFKQALEGTGNYTNVTIPISNFEVESNLEFSMSAIYPKALPEKEESSGAR